MNELQKHLEKIRDNSPRWLCYDGPEGYEWPKSYEESIEELEKIVNNLLVQVANKRDK